MADNDILARIALCTERGKIDKASPYPPDLKGEDGVNELTETALNDGVDPNDILAQGFMEGMGRLGKKYSNNEVFVPDLLMAAKAMNAGMKRLKPYFDSGAAKRKGIFVIGTVRGDLHDIGKNLVRMMIEGGGWEVIDLGVDTAPEDFVEAVKKNPNCAVGLSALLTTTMVNMEETVKAIKAVSPNTPVIVGGAPLTQDFCDKIGADAYSPDPQGALDYLAAHLAA